MAPGCRKLYLGFDVNLDDKLKGCYCNYKVAALLEVLGDMGQGVRSLMTVFLRLLENAQDFTLEGKNAITPTSREERGPLLTK